VISWARILRDAIWTETPTAHEAALIAAIVIVVPFGWLILLVRPLRRLLRSR
jgi:hypothetical protein